MTLQGDIEGFFLGLTNLRDITGTNADDQTKLRHALSSIESGFISRLITIDCCFEELLRCVKAVDPIQRYTGYGLVISKFLQVLLTQDDDYAWSCAHELRRIRHLITSDYSGARAILSSMKMRFKNPTLKAQTFQMISEMEEKNKEISNICVDLFANDFGRFDENLEECLLETRQKCTWFRVKLEHAAAGGSSREVSLRP